MELPPALLSGPARRRHHQPAGGDRRAGRRRPAGRRHARERHAQHRARGRQDDGAGGIRRARAAGIQRRTTSSRSCPTASAVTVDGDGVKRGVMAAAAIIFFAFYGFDAVATSAEEAKNPGRDLKIGIIGSMVVCTLIYMLVAVAAVGAVNHAQVGESRRAAGASSCARSNIPLAAHAHRPRGGDRAADGDPGVHVRPEPHLLRDGARRPAAAAAERGVGAHRHAGARSPRSPACSSPRSRASSRSTRSPSSPMPARCWRSSPSPRA